MVCVVRKEVYEIHSLNCTVIIKKEPKQINFPPFSKSRVLHRPQLQF